MPGLHYLRSRTTIRVDDIEAALARVGLPHDRAKILWSDGTSVLAAKAYPAYPVACWEDAGFVYAVEGCLYNLDHKQLKAALAELAGLIFLREDSDSRLAGWLRSQDGEFLIWIRERRTGRSALINDIFGSLPAFWFEDEEHLIVSRDPRLINALKSPLAFDSLGLAQLLALGGALGGRTLWRNVNRLPPAALLMDEGEGRTAAINTLFSIDFSQQERQGRSLETNARDLVELFRPACRRRQKRRSGDLIFLSGGLDSRAVAGGLAGEKEDVFAATFARSDAGKALEVQAARETAQRLGLPWELIRTPPISARAALELLRTKSGLNTLALAHIVPFYKALLDEHSQNVTLFTGDGGDRTLPAIHPPRSFPDIRTLAAYICDYEYYTEWCLLREDASALTGVGPKDLLDSIEIELKAYPERSFESKFVHYALYGEAFGYLHEGQDRNRCWFWNTSPFYSRQFFFEAMACPDGQKAAYGLYRRFLELLFPGLESIPYSNLGAPLTSPRASIQWRISRAKSRWPRQVRRIKRLIKGAEGPRAEAPIFDLIRGQARNCPALGQYLDLDFLSRVLADGGRYHPRQIMNILTVCAAIEDMSCGRSSLEDLVDTGLL